MNSSGPKLIQNIQPPVPSRQDRSEYFQSKTDAEIWVMFRAGHEGAFKFIYDAYFDLLFHYGLHFTEDGELIKDGIHDLFVELRQGKNISHTDCIRFYLLKAFRWKVQRIILQRRRLSFFGSKEAAFKIDAEISYETKLINAQIDEETLRRLDKALKRLTSRQKEALYHFYHQNLSYLQVAQIMKLSNVKSARNLIYKALDSLKVYFNLGN